MPMTAVSQCFQCAAVVNIHWPSCLVCRATLPPSLEVPAPLSTVSVTQRQVNDVIAPLLPGWLVTYRDPTGKLCGGSEERTHGTVLECRWTMGRWTVGLTDGQQVPLSIIQAVASTHSDGRIRAAWNVREHGYDGHRSPKG